MDIPDYEEPQEIPETIAYDLNADQLAIAQRLQQKVLQLLELKLDRGIISPTEMATLVRLLAQNGWTLDPSRLPQSLRDRLTDAVDFDDDSEDGGIIPISRKMA